MLSTPPVPTFYQRPLTWLFWIAALCLDAVALSIDHEGSFATSLALGQLFVVSGWLVLGKSHPLARATWFVVAIAVLIAPDFVIPRLRSGFYRDLVWPHVLGELIAASVFTALAVGGWLALLRGVAGNAHEPQPTKPQFSLATIFGWMIVVAVASTGLRIADFSLIDDNSKDLISGCGLALAAATMMAAALGDYRATWLTRAASLFSFTSGVAMSLSVGMPVNATAVQIDRHARLAAVHIGAWAFVATWIIVARLDRRTAAKVIAPVAKHIAPASALRLFADER